MLEMRIARALHVLAMGAGAFISFQGVARAETKAGETLDRIKPDAVFWRCEAAAIISRWIAPTQSDQSDHTRWNHDQSPN